MAFTTHPPSSAEVKERIELYLYSASGLSWPILGFRVNKYVYGLYKDRTKRDGCIMAQ